MSDTPSPAPALPQITDDLILVGAAGTNKVMAGELSRLVRRALTDVHVPEPVKEGQGALVYPFHAAAAAVAVTYHRTSSRVLWGLYRSRAARLEPLYDDLLAAVTVETRPWLRDGLSFSVSPGPTEGFAAGGRQLVGVVKNALIDGAARRGLSLRVDAEHPDVWFLVRVHEAAVSVSIDLAGGSMSQRGYRTEGGGVAPLRESLAAVLVMLTRHDPRTEALIDPMAGSGTLAIEAACMAQGRPVWVPPRGPAARHLPPLEALLGGEAPHLFGDTRPLVFANELEAPLAALTRENAARAGVGDLLDVSISDFRRLDPDILRSVVRARGLDPERGVILANPPYGERLFGPASGGGRSATPDQLTGLYRDLGRWCRTLQGWRAGFLVANPEFEVAFGGVPRVKKPLSNAALRGYFYLYDL